MRVWDKFLTERDKEHLEQVWRKSARFGLGQIPVLLVIDDCYVTVVDKPLPILESVKTWPMSCGQEGWQAIYKTADLLKAARANSIPVIYMIPRDTAAPGVLQRDEK